MIAMRPYSSHLAEVFGSRQEYDGVEYGLRSAMSQLPDEPPRSSPLHPDGPRMSLGQRALFARIAPDCATDTHSETITRVAHPSKLCGDAQPPSPRH